MGKKLVSITISDIAHQIGCAVKPRRTPQGLHAGNKMEVAIATLPVSCSEAVERVHVDADSEEVIAGVGQEVVIVVQHVLGVVALP